MYRLESRTDVGDGPASFLHLHLESPVFPPVAAPKEQGPLFATLLTSMLLCWRAGDFLLQLFFCLYLCPFKYDRSRLCFSKWSIKYTQWPFLLEPVACSLTVKVYPSDTSSPSTNDPRYLESI